MWNVPKKTGEIKVRSPLTLGTGYIFVGVYLKR